MRKLAIFVLGFAAAAAASVWLLPPQLQLLIAAVLLVAAAATFFGRRLWQHRLRIAAFGAAVGLLWCWIYQREFLPSPQALQGEDLQLSGLVCQSPEATDYGCALLIKAEGQRVRLYLALPPDTFAIGDRVTVTADVIDVTSGVDGSFYYRAQDITRLAYARGEPVVEKADSLPVELLPQTLTASLREQILATYQGDTGLFLQALLSGHNALPYETKTDLSVTGLSHVVAVSGMHVSILTGLVLTLCLRRRRLASVVTIGVLILFGAMLGFTPSVSRAVMMNIIMLLAPLFGRENDPPTSLALSLLVLLGINPWAIASVSLQLSYGAVVGVFLFQQRLTKAFLRPFGDEPGRLLRGICTSLGVSLGAQIFTVPLLALYFGTISLVSPLTNLLAVPVISWCFSGGFLLSLLSYWLMPLAQALSFLAEVPVRYVLWLVQTLADFSYAAIYTDSRLTAWWLLAVYVMLFFHLWARPPMAYLLAGVGLTLAGTIGFQFLRTPEVSIQMLDVGQGQCILLRMEDTCVMVDCGGDDGDRAGERAARQLLISGENYLDAIVLTHYDRDHTGGLQQVLSRLEVGCLYVPDIEGSGREELLATAAEYGVLVRFVTADIDFAFGSGALRLLVPGREDGRNVGLSALMSVEEYDILITGDMDLEAEYILLARQKLPDVEVLVAGHHGSKSATSMALLQRTQPEVVLISVGDNSYGHPAQEVLDRCAAVGAQVYRTDLNGDITIMR